MIKLVANADEEQKSVSKKATMNIIVSIIQLGRNIKIQLKQRMKSIREIVQLPKSNVKKLLRRLVNKELV